jgi:CD2 antigen cytoplasmic tail-binding protein 2
MASSSRKRKLEDASDDYSAGIEGEMSKSMANPSSHKKHTMDSDEEEEDDDEYNRKKYDVLKEDDIEGQEEATQEFEGETKLTPFNMKDELEEGYFDGSGMYIWNKKDASEIKDSWLDSIDWMSVKKVDPSKMPPPVPEDDSSSEDELSVKPAPVEVYEEVLSFLKPGESIIKAIKRLGKGGGKQLTASERLKQKKLAKLKGLTEAPKEAETGDKVALEKLTGLANQIMSLTGNMDVYDETYESLAFKISKASQTPEKPPEKPLVADDGLDMFSDDYEPKTEKA